MIPLADQLFTLREARDILDDPMRDMRYLETRMGPEIQAHLNYKRLRRGSPETWDAKERILARLAVAIPDVSVAEITYEHLERHLLTIPERSWRTHRSHINGFVKWAIQFDRRSAKNPVELLPELLGQTRVPVYDIFTDAEWGALVNAARFMDDPVRDRARALLLRDSGIRKKEARMLVGRRIDATARCIVVEGKGSRERLIPIRGEFWQAWEHCLLEPIPKLGRPMILTDHVWFPMRVAGEYKGRARQVTASYPDRPMSQRGFHEWWERLVAHAGVEYRKPHMTRHTYATDALDASDGDIYGVKELLGHSSTKVTEVYLHSSRRRKESVVEHLARVRRNG